MSVLYFSQPIGISVLRVQLLLQLLGHFVGIVLIVSQYLFDMNDFRAGVPCDTTAHQIPILAFLDGNFLQRREC